MAKERARREAKEATAAALRQEVEERLQERELAMVRARQQDKHEATLAAEANLREELECRLQ